VGIAAPFLKYDRKGLDVTIEFKVKLNKEEGKMGGKEGWKEGGLIVREVQLLTPPFFPSSLPPVPPS